MEECITVWCPREFIGAVLGTLLADGGGELYVAAEGGLVPEPAGSI